MAGVLRAFAARTVGCDVARRRNRQPSRLTLMSEEPVEPAAPEPCSACRGTGVVISHLGGEPSELPCPWCDGGGVRLRGHDTQARWRDGTSEQR